MLRFKSGLKYPTAFVNNFIVSINKIMIAITPTSHQASNLLVTLHLWEGFLSTFFQPILIRLRLRKIFITF